MFFICTDVNESSFYLVVIMYSIWQGRYTSYLGRWASSNSSFKGGGEEDSFENFWWIRCRCLGFMGTCWLQFGCCRAFSYLEQGMWGISCLLEDVFHEYWDFSRGSFKFFLELGVIVCVLLLVPLSDGYKEVNIPSCNFKHLNEGLIFVWFFSLMAVFGNLPWW